MTAEFLTALSLFITTVVGAVVTLRQAFKKTNTKIDETNTKIDQVHDRTCEIKDTINGGGDEAPHRRYNEPGHPYR